MASINDRVGSRFSDLARAPGLSRRVLADRLRRLIDMGLVATEQYSQHPPRSRYVLSERGGAVRRHCILMLHVAAGGVMEPAESMDASTPDRAPRASPERVGEEQHPATRLLEADPIAAQQIIDETVGALIQYDAQYRTQLLDTLEAYLDSSASTSVAAARLFAHRHTIRYRLSRVHELTGLDVDLQDDRERLALGVRALRLFGDSDRGR